MGGGAHADMALYGASHLSLDCHNERAHLLWITRAASFGGTARREWDASTTKELLSASKEGGCTIASGNPTLHRTYRLAGSQATLVEFKNNTHIKTKKDEPAPHYSYY